MKKNTYITIVAILIISIAILSVFAIKNGSKQSNIDSEELTRIKKIFNVELNQDDNEYYITGLTQKGNSVGSNIFVPATIDNIPVTKILDRNRSFGDYSNVIGITIGKNIKYIGPYDSGELKYGEDIFLGARSLTNISVFEGNTTYKAVDGVLYNYDCSILLKYPANKKNSNLAFDNFQVVEGVKEIYQKAFYNNYNIESVIISNTVTNIGYFAFGGCNKLSSITLGSGVEQISSKAFDGCSLLDSIILPKSLKTVGANAFMGCSKLSKVIFNSVPLNCGKNLFVSCNNLTNIDAIDIDIDALVDIINSSMGYNFVKSKATDDGEILISKAKECF